MPHKNSWLAGSPPRPVNHHSAARYTVNGPTPSMHRAECLGSGFRVSHCPVLPPPSSSFPPCELPRARPTERQARVCGGGGGALWPPAVLTRLFSAPAPFRRICERYLHANIGPSRQPPEGLCETDRPPNRCRVGRKTETRPPPTGKFRSSAWMLLDRSFVYESKILNSFHSRLACRTGR